MSEDYQQPDLPPWSRWYRDVREEMAVRYGRKSVSVDTYK